MKIAVSSQNFRQITGHAGRARRFLVYVVDDAGRVVESERLDLPKELAMHGFDDRIAHPLYGMDVLITGGAGAGFQQRLAAQGVRVAVTGETDPEAAVRAFLAGTLKAPIADCSHDHAHEEHAEHGDEAGCGCHD